MKKILSFLAGLIVFSLIIGVVAGFIFWSRAPDVLANNLSKKLGVKVEIEDIDLGTANIIIENFEIGNVSRGILPKAFSVQKVDFQTPLTKYLDQKIVINKIQMDDVYLGLEFDSPTSTSGNWTQIMSNLQKSTNPNGVQKKKKSKQKNVQQQQPQSSGKSALIQELVINNITVDVLYLQSNTKVKRLPVIKQIVIKNINTEEGFPIDQLMNSVLGQMLQQVFIKENLKNMIQSLINDPSQINDFLQPFKGLFGG